MKRDMHLVPVRVKVPAGTSKADVQAMLERMILWAGRESKAIVDSDDAAIWIADLVVASDFDVCAVPGACRDCGEVLGTDHDNDCRVIAEEAGSEVLGEDCD